MTKQEEQIRKSVEDKYPSHLYSKAQQDRIVKHQLEMEKKK